MWSCPRPYYWWEWKTEGRGISPIFRSFVRCAAGVGCPLHGWVTNLDDTGHVRIYTQSVVRALQEHLNSTDHRLGAPLENLVQTEKNMQGYIHTYIQSLSVTYYTPVICIFSLVRMYTTLALHLNAGYYIFFVFVKMHSNSYCNSQIHTMMTFAKWALACSFWPSKWADALGYWGTVLRMRFRLGLPTTHMCVSTPPCLPTPPSGC